MYLENRLPWFPSSVPTVGRSAIVLLLLFPLLDFVGAWLQNSLSSSNCMYLETLFLSSSKLAVDCIQRLSANSPGRKADNTWCMATSGLRFRMLISTLPNDKGSQRLSLLLADTNQGNGGQVVRSTSGKQCLKLGHQRHKDVNRVGRELCELGKSSSFQ